MGGILINMITPKMVEEAKNATLASMMRDVAERASNVAKSSEVADRIMRQLEGEIENEDLIDLEDMEVQLSTWGKTVYLCKIKSKAIFEALQIVLVELYGEGKKSDFCGDVRYSFESDKGNWRENVDIEMTVSTKITGCKLLKEQVYVEEKVTPAHYEEKTIIKCDD